MRTHRRDVAPEHGLKPWSGLAKSFLVGKATVALHRARGKPGVAMRAARANRGQPRGLIRTASGRPGGRALFVVPAGPGDLEGLIDVVESIRAFEGPAATILVIDDATVDCRPSDVQRRFPDVDVLRRVWPTGGSPQLWRSFASAYATALDVYEFDVLCKIDTDALLTGPLSADALALFRAEPEVGMLGTVHVRGDGRQVDYSYDRWVLSHEERWTPSLRRMVRAIEDRDRDPAVKVHGGVYLISREALAAARERGWLSHRQPWWSITPEDLLFSMAIWASGYEVRSFGAPGDPIVSGSHSLPMDKQEVLDRGVAAIHSVRRGLRGEGEQELRAFFRAARRAAPHDGRTE